MSTCIKSQYTLPGFCRKKEIWKIITDFSSLSEFVPQINTVRILEKDENTVRTEWYITLDGAPFSWIECNTLDSAGYTVRSESVSGDFDLFKSTWNIEDSKNEKIRLSCSLEYELGIPVIEENLGTILRDKLQKYIDDSVSGTCSKATDGTRDERRFERVKLDNDTSLYINGRTVEVKMRDFSCGGMMIHLKKGMIGTDTCQEVVLQFADVALRGFLHFEPFYRTHRIIFSKPLEKADFDAITDVWKKGHNTAGDMVRIYNIVSASLGHSSINRKGSPV